jgi:hypothetical protein
MEPSTSVAQMVSIHPTNLLKFPNFLIEYMESYNKRRIRPAPLTRKSALSKKNQGAQEKALPGENNGLWSGFLAKLGCIKRENV